MVTKFLEISQTYPIDRTDNVTLNNSYLALKIDVMSKIRSAVMERLGLTLTTPDNPTATGTQTFTDTYNDNVNWGCQFRTITTFTISTAITISLQLFTVKNNVQVAFNTTRNIAVSVNNPTEVRVDCEILLVKTANFIKPGFTRADGLIYPITDVFLAAGYGLIRYYSFPKKQYEWGWVSDSISGHPISIINATALAVYAFPVQLTAGYLKADSTVYKLMSMKEIYFSATNSAADSFICRLDCDNELLLVTQPSPIIPTGNKVKIGTDVYYIVGQLNGKAILALI